MYSFFDLSSTKAARMMASAGAVLIAVILVAGHFAANPSPTNPMTLSPDAALSIIGALA